MDPKETKIEYLMQFEIVQIANLMDSKIIQMKKVNVCMSFCLYKYDEPQNRSNQNLDGLHNDSNRKFNELQH